MAKHNVVDVRVSEAMCCSPIELVENPVNVADR